MDSRRTSRPPAALALAACSLAAARPATADCPTNIRDMEPTGFLASMTRELTGPGERDMTPGFEARLRAAGGMRATSGASADATATPGSGAPGRELAGSAALGAEVRAHRGSVSGCASGDLVDVRDAAAHVTASGQIPMLFTGLTVGFVLDRDVTLPLASRPEYLRAPVSRFAAQFSASFLDLAMTEQDRHYIRMLVMPFTIEMAAARQDTLDDSLARQTTAMEVAMIRIVTRDKLGPAGEFSLFAIDVDWIEPAAGTTSMSPPEQALAGFARISPLALRYSGPTWSFELDGGVLSPAGPVNCDESGIDCAKGWMRGALSRNWDTWSLGARLERDAFIAADNLPALENRASVEGGVARGKLRVTGGAFVADTHAWLDGAGGQRGGVRASLSHALGHGFSGQLDSEIVRSNAAQPELASGARLLLSVGWQHAVQR